MQVDWRKTERALNVVLFKFDTKTRIRLWRKLGKMMNDGIPIIAALEELRAMRSPKEPLAMALSDWISGMNNGKRLSESVGDWVTAEESMLLMSGEQSGSLPEAMKSIVVVTKAKQGISSAIRKGLTYPTFLILMSFGILYLFSYKIIPAFMKSARGDHWSGMARYMVDTSNFAQSWLHWIVLLVLLLIAGFIVSLPRWTSKTRTSFDRYVPYSVYRTSVGASWLIGMAALLKAGVRMESALELTMKYSTPWAKVRIAAALRGLRAGRNLGEALHTNGYEFPDREIISDIRVYASKSGIDEAMRMIADEWITESVERIESLMAKVFGVTLLIVGSIAAFEISGMLAMQLQLMHIMQQPLR